ncbi:zinc-binding dehydrogenase [Rubrobacter tropicus]|uniref:Zinc-binding dehydrogenase n=1 Tax=Rubrobacter tropicus TaxID=2653851 RepID=A0A6G8QAP8_9ACTN|nr:zinc-binding dehydrogenase [Rubrobacter tropicus]QIN83541.1 zinc-binding dehydrogenase [Rubrobacter tropicus]
MKAIRLHELGGPENLVYEDVPDPEPGSGEVVVKVRAAALNRRDVFVTRGMYPGAKPEALPATLGSDGSGEVVARGEGADGPDEGTEVVINPALYWGDDPAVPGKEYRILGLPDEGTFAQFVKVPGDHVLPKPSHLSHEEAAAVPLAGLTAYRALVTRGQVREGETVVVPGVGGGVATFLVQIASALGARVFVTSGDDEKIEAAKKLGAEGGVNYNAENWSKELKGMAGGVDLSVDSVGGPTFDALLSLAKPGGRIVSFGATAGPVEKLVLPKIFLKHLTVLGTAMGTAEEFGAMLDLYAERGLRPTINETFPLEEATAAMGLMEKGSGVGKIVLDVPA